MIRRVNSSKICNLLIIWTKDSWQNIDSYDHERELVIKKTTDFLEQFGWLISKQSNFAVFPVYVFKWNKKVVYQFYFWVFYYVPTLMSIL